MEAIKPISAMMVRPKPDDGDLPGYKPKVPVFPPGTKPSPYVRDKQGFIWQYMPFMDMLGDVLEPCWEAPPKASIMIANSPLDLAIYGKQAHQPDKPRRGRKRKSEQTATDVEKAVKSDDAERGPASISG